MSEFHRYAVYYLPDDPDLAAFGARWLGWDVVAGVAVAQPAVAGIADITRTPRSYGFHGTLKPPFRLAEGTSADALNAEVAALAARLAPVEVAGLRLSRLGAFLALTPRGPSEAIGALAFACVSQLDAFRRPPGEAELARRRASRLSPRQEALLLEWGYPYVADQFRFHMTLTGKLDDADLIAAQDVAESLLPPLPEPLRIGSISLAGAGDDGCFRLVRRYALAG